jgi:hypothetical protein
LATKLAKARGDSKEPPEGYEENNDRINVPIPVQDRYYHPAKWVQQLDDRQVALLTGLRTNEDPYIINIYTSPKHNSDNPIDSLPSWFTDFLIGSSSTYNVLKESLAKCHNWAYMAEAERYRQMDEELGVITNELHILQAQRGQLEERLAACRFHMEGAHIPAKVSYLECCFPPQLGRRGQ